MEWIIGIFILMLKVLLNNSNGNLKMVWVSDEQNLVFNHMKKTGI